MNANLSVATRQKTWSKVLLVKLAVTVTLLFTSGCASQQVSGQNALQAHQWLDQIIIVSRNKPPTLTEQSTLLTALSMTCRSHLKQAKLLNKALRFRVDALVLAQKSNASGLP
ncbi:hypothetical protein LJ739_13685 [Aestuariibacter halophilus]|uniref:Uncharacterized protein n=1 Tax=Fluctibacter halophilus TaxID=226011 RepID=A0ABS8G9T6_9ALTE|nr:hypothetical protein [Aestuariibacter halophilus]MCC2617300.1 hypothetical protein [Aestuariibacter halophilus]